MEDEKLLAILKYACKSRSGRDSWNSLWEELAFYFLPERKGFITQRNDGEDLTDELWTSTPQLARRGLATAISTMLRPAGREWFKAKAKRFDLNLNENVRAWLDMVTQITYNALYDPRAQAEEKLAEADADLVTFGTAIVDVGFDRTRKHLVFETVPLKDMVLMPGRNGDIDMGFRFRTMTVREIADTFPEAQLTDKMNEKLRGANPDPDFKFEICHACMPNEDYRRFGLGLSAKGPRLPYVSVWFAVEEKKILSRGGYYDFKYITPRWDTMAGEVYARCPAMVGLNDARLVNAITRTLIASAEKAVDPPLVAPADVIRGDVELIPGGVTYFDGAAFAFQGDPIKPLNLGKQLPWTLDFLDRVENRLYAAFYRDILELPNLNEKDITATEVNARLDQYLRQAAPVFARIESDYNAALVNRVFSILFREGFFPPPPEELYDEEIDFEYESPIKAAREKASALKILEGAAAILPMAEASPDVLDNINFDSMTRSVLMGYGWPQELFTPFEQMMQIREKRAKDMEMAKMAELANKAGPAIAQLTQAGASATDSGMIGADQMAMAGPNMGEEMVSPDIFDLDPDEFEEVA